MCDICKPAPSELPAPAGYAPVDQIVRQQERIEQLEYTLLKLQAMIAGKHLAKRMENGDELLAVIASGLEHNAELTHSGK